MIHIVNGDVVGKKIKDLDGDVIVWREMYDLGPLTKDSSTEEFMIRRAIFFEKKLGIPSTIFITNCKNQNQLLNDLQRSTEITLWFEHDRYDQTMFMFLLHELSRKGFHNLSMVSVNYYPCIEPFYGLGQLSSSQLRDLFNSNKQPISPDQIHEAITGWTAYTSPNPSNIENWIATSKDQLPFLKQALQTHLSYFPSIHTGLNEVEYLALCFVNGRTCSFTQLYQYICQQRICDGLSDLHFSAILNQLIQGNQPLLQVDVPLPTYNNPESRSYIKLTSYGLHVLQRKRDRFELIGMDWWVGGVYLQQGDWRRSEQGIIKRSSCL